MTMLKTLATVAVAVVAIAPAVEMNESPFLGGYGHNAILKQAAAIGGAGVILIQGSDEIDEPASGDSSWTTTTTLNSASPLEQEITLSRWMRANVTVAGTAANLLIQLKGVQ